jgi:hypothetical protein
MAYQSVQRNDFTVPAETKSSFVDEAQFLTDLTALSQKYRIGIAGDPLLFAMETGSHGDDERSYKCGKDSKLSFV